MQLITILLVAVSVLTLLSGLSVMVGATKGERGEGVAFFVSALAAFAWSVAMAMFLNATDYVMARWELTVMYLGTLLMEVALIFYVGWKYTYGKVSAIISALVLIFMSVVLIMNPSMLFASVTLSRSGNTVEMARGWYAAAYVVFVILLEITFVLTTFYKIRHSSNSRVRKGYTFLLVGLFTTGLLGTIFDIILPFMGEYGLIWLGPLAVSATIILQYYAILRYRLLILSSAWLKIMSYIILMSLAAMAYMLIFFTIFTALFKIPNPSAAIIVLNFIMIVIVLLLLPVINEINAFIRSLISVQQVDIAYIVKKLNKLAATNVDLGELAAFLADHLHFQYIGLIVGGRLYGSKQLPISAKELSEISMLEESEKSIWQKIDGSTKQLFDKLGIKAVAELRNGKGRPYGQILVGRPLGKISFERRDLIQIEMIVNLVAAVIDSEKHVRA